MAGVSTKDLTGAALDLAVAQADPQCAGLEYKTINGVMAGVDPEGGLICLYFLPSSRRALDEIKARGRICAAGGEHAQGYAPSTDWAKGGPIIERERIQLFTAGNEWMAKVNCQANNLGDGATPLVAAMRAYVSAKLGEVVDVPDELRAQSDQKGGGL